VRQAYVSTRAERRAPTEWYDPRVTGNAYAVLGRYAIFRSHTLYPVDLSRRWCCSLGQGGQGRWEGWRGLGSWGGWEWCRELGRVGRVERVGRVVGAP